MKRFFILVNCLFFIVFLLLSEIPEGYYDSAKGKTGYKLKTTLYHIVKDHTDIGYKKLFDAYKTTDTRPGNIVWDMYSDIPGGTPPYIYYHRKKTCGNYKKESDCYNREHSLPQSWFKKKRPMKSDLFHVYPSDGYVNHARGSWPYGEVSDPAWTSKNRSKLGRCSFPGYPGIVFEPIDEYKGDFARTYFYMATRYENKIAKWKKGTAKKVLDGSKERVFKEWVVKLFLKWHKNDPVSQKEINRNDAVYELQKNRNPFIDHPEYVGMIWGDETGTGGTEVSILSETFETCPEDWVIYSVSGSKDWECNKNGYVEINAYKGMEVCNDWLVTPALNLDKYSDEVLTFETWTKYSDNFYPPVRVKYSFNYNGSGNPNEADWTDITVTVAAENSQTLTSSGKISLSNIEGSSVYIAFQYRSSGTGPGSSSLWKLDNVSIKGKTESDN